MSTARRVIKNTGLLYCKMALTMFVSLYTIRIILKALGAADFGLFALVGGAIAMLGFLGAAMASSTQRFMSFYEGEGNKIKKRQIFNVSIVLHFAISLVILIIFLLCGWFFFNGFLKIAPERVYAAKIVYGSLIVSTILTIMSVPYDAILNAKENMFYYSIIGILEAMLKLCSAVFVKNYSGDRLILYGVFMAIIPIITLICMRIYCHLKYDECTFKVRSCWDSSLMLEMTKFAGWNLLGIGSGMISQYGLSLVLNSFFGTILNASQGIANQISGQLMVFSNTMLKALNPIIAKSEGNGQRDYMIKTSLIGSKYSYLLLSIFSVPFIIETPFILNVWLGKVPQWAILFTRLQLLRSLIEQLTIMFGTVIMAQGEIKEYSKIKSCLNILPIIISSILFYLNFPPFYLYIVWIFCGGLLGGYITLYYVKKRCNFQMKHYVKSVLIPCLTITILMFFIGIFPVLLLEKSILRLSLVSFITTIIFANSLYFLFMTSEEKIVFSNLVISVFKKVKLCNLK